MPTVAEPSTASRRRQEGQGLVEYALMLMLIAVVAISALLFLGSNVSSSLSSGANALQHVTCTGERCHRDSNEEH